MGCGRRLRSFLFIFEQANRIIWEPPLHGNATYLFEIESPLPIDDQVWSDCRQDPRAGVLVCQLCKPLATTHTLQGVNPSSCSPCCIASL